MKITYMSAARGARMILDANLRRASSPFVVKECPVCGARLTVLKLREAAPLAAHYTPGRHSTLCEGQQ